MILDYGSLIVAMAALFGFLGTYADAPPNTDVARRDAFAVAAFSQLANAMVYRSQRHTLPELILFSNPWLLVDS